MGFTFFYSVFPLALVFLLKGTSINDIRQFLMIYDSFPPSILYDFQPIKSDFWGHFGPLYLL